MPVPQIGSGELLVRVEASGICGSDVMEWYRLDRAPLVLGHEVGGRVVAVGGGVERYRFRGRGTLDGLAYTMDDGQTWGFLRFSAPTGFLDQADTYAYPNPFSPSREELGVKIRYSLRSEAVVTIKIYDWALNLVRKISAGRVIPNDGGQELLEFWNGRNEDGQVVANGVYFYTIETDQGDQARGKIVVLY